MFTEKGKLQHRMHDSIYIKQKNTEMYFYKWKENFRAQSNSGHQ